jgi:ParB family chromosome partitioning protein
LGKTVLRTYRRKADIDDVYPNDRQPSLGGKEDEELQRQIEANEGLFEPLLVEPHPERSNKLRIIDGERRWTNSRALVSQGREQYRHVPVEVTDRTLTDEQTVVVEEERVSPYERPLLVRRLESTARILSRY